MKTKNKIPMRQCTGCREMKSKKEMLKSMIFNRFIQTFSGKTQICASAVFLTGSIKHDLIFCSLKKELEDIEK